MHLRFRSFAQDAKKPTRVAHKFYETALRAEFALNAAKHFKEEIRYGKT